MTQKNTPSLIKKLEEKMDDDECRDKIREWWFDDALYPSDENDSKEIRTEMKRYYAFIQIFYHENFRKSNAEIDECLKGLIEKVESEEQYKSCGKRDKKLKNLILGSAYRRLGQFKTERYQSAETEHVKANYYLEQDTSFFKLTASENADYEEDFVITLLYLLNKAKYFRDIAEKDALRVDASYCRALMLFQEIKSKIEEKQAQRQGKPIEGILARIYVSAWLNIAQVYRFQQEYELSAIECIKLVNFCINSIENKKEKKEVREIINKLPKMPIRKQNIAQNREQDNTQVKEQDNSQLMEHEQNLKSGFSVEKYESKKRNMVDYLFEDYILQALLQLGISYRDRVDFNGSREGNLWVRQAMYVFLALGVVDRIKDNGKDESAKNIEGLLDELLKLDLNSKDASESLIEKIKNVCINSSTSKENVESQLKNADAQNNLAVCLKKLGYYTASIAILTDATLKGNRFAEYNLCKCYLESGITEKMEIIHQYCYKEEAAVNDKPVYVYPDEPEKSNYKWLLLYARYLFAQKKFDEAEKLFSLIRNNRTMQWDSLELKAAYLEAQCQIQRGKYLSAVYSFRNIHESLLKLDNERSKRRHEIRTEIDLGWCLIVEDRYEEALNVYRDLLVYLVWNEQPENFHNQKNQSVIEQTLEELKKNIDPMQKSDIGTDFPYAMKWHAVSRPAQAKILHNLYDCWTYLLMKDSGGINDNVTKLIISICKSNAGNAPDNYLRFLQGLRNMNKMKRESRKGDDNNKRTELLQEWKQLSDDFGEVLKERPLDTITYSCWVIGKVNYCMLLSKQHPEFEPQKKQLLLGLVSSATAITMKSYIEVAQIILNKNAGSSFLDITKETKHNEDMALERAFLELFCHVNLLKNGTNQAFMKLMTNQNFHSIELVTRAKLLASIVELYGDILQMKTQLRVTYTDLEAFAHREQDGSQKKDEQPIICQYTRLSTLKGILPKMSRGTNGETVESEPKFRMSNAARMNDTSEGAMFKKICEHEAGPEKLGIKETTYNEIIQKYIDNSSGYKNADEISSYDSDVYIASFSMNRNNFGLWSNYADKEKGCIIGFDQSFFDLVDKNYYSILDDEAEENALYRILYVDENEWFSKGKNPGIKNPREKEKNATEIMDIETIKACIPHILQKLSGIEEKLQDEKQITPEAAGVIRAFIVDRLNEIRFLFKSVSYEYEEEMRMLRCSQNPEAAETDLSPVPWLYINVEKKLDNLTLILGSRVELQQVKELSVWAKSTGRVKQIMWSGLNRL